MLVEGALILIIGIVIGRLWGKDRKKNTGLKDPKPVCGCKHHYSMHDAETGHCHGQVRGNPLRYDSFDDPTAWEMVQCPCRRYAGPEPLPTLYAPEIAS